MPTARSAKKRAAAKKADKTKAKAKPKPKSKSKAPAKAKPKSKAKPKATPKLEVRSKRRKKLKGISDIRRFFHRNDAPVFFISATNFNLIGIDEWVSNFKFINYIDCFDGHHPNLIAPPEIPHEQFESIEDINNYLLRHPEVQNLVHASGGGRAVFLMFDAETEKLCNELGLKVCFPSAKLRTAVDDKINTTRIGNRAGVKSVPNVLARVTSWKELRSVSKKLGKDLVIQTAFGDSGHTTFFISNEKDWNKHAEEIAEAPEVKVMKRIRCRQTAIEACVTRHGTIVGPLMTELVGFRELTPYKGGWCGNEVFADAFARKVRNQARTMTFRFGEELRRMGYRGYFELDLLLDEEDGKLYLGEVNPRITGASSMTNLAAFAHADAPLFLFHLLEYMGVPYDLDVDELNKRWSAPENIDPWSQLVLKFTDDDVRLITGAPRSGIYEIDSEGRMHFLRVQTHRRTVSTESRAFFLRIAKEGDYFYKGADMGILVTRGRLMDERFRLNRRAKTWINAVRSAFRSESLSHRDADAAQQTAEVGGFKML
ncbi:MAG: biotin carboxylase [Planctomycetota bacterium]